MAEQHPMQSPTPLAMGATCGASTRSGGVCRARPMPNGRCRMHGGKSLAGVASPTWKNGGRSRYTPAGRLGERYARHLADLDYLSLTSEMALLTARVEELVENGRMDGPEGRKEIVELIEQRRKLAETEGKRIKMAADTLTGEQRAAFGRAVLEAVRRHVPDLTVVASIQADVLRAIQAAHAADA